MPIEQWDREDDGTLRLHELADARVGYDEEVVLLRMQCTIAEGVETFVQLWLSRLHAERLAAALLDAIAEMDADSYGP